MSTKTANRQSTAVTNTKKRTIDLLAGGAAGLFEALCCHPLDTIKVRMQLYKKGSDPAVKAPGLIKTGVTIFKDEGFFALYKGLGAVCLGIVPKMAIRFSSFEFYKSLMANKETGKVSGGATFLSGVLAGVTEACAVVNPMEVVKIRLQAQHNAMKEAGKAGAKPKYTNAIQAGYLIVKEEGFRTLYRGVALTAGRQAINQGANFTCYTYLKGKLQHVQQRDTLPTYQTAIIGFISGAIGPFCNNPLDTIKTRLQKETGVVNESNFSRGLRIGKALFKESGVKAFYKGIIPRVARVASGQCIVFPVYEFFKGEMYDFAGIERPKRLKA
ncbi:DEKNAAC101835 [Brettanomyces naardenensis]|uniref:DEKNAAC101835 n=1 Tax=Brettanomyces naardenensis TaxID=13370 RepID=A0A448YIX7_BRENA|nr:DEKNAAC101835 [Brettanomyces naardenensis]